MPYGTTPYAKRFGSLKGHRIPFGAEIRYMSLDHGKAVKDAPFAEKTSSGLFIGYYLYPGGKWTGDYLVISTDHLAHADNVYNVKVVRVKDIVPAQHHAFPVKSKMISQPEDRQEDSSWFDDDDASEGGPDGPPQTNEDGDFGECSVDTEPQPPPEPDFWSMRGEFLVRHHISPRTNLYSPDINDCPFPVRWLDVHRVTDTDLDDAAEKHIEDWWDGSEGSNRALSHPWVGTTKFSILYPPLEMGWQYFGGRATRIKSSEKRRRYGPKYGLK